MDITAYRDEIRLKLTGSMLDLELEDSTIDKIIESTLREIQRYICDIELITIPFSYCIDLSVLKKGNVPIKISSISRIFRTTAFAGSEASNNTNFPADPMYAAQWQLISGAGTMYNFQDYMLNYAAWNTLNQIRNTTSTDLLFYYDKADSKLYINVATNPPGNITIEYIPRYDNVDDIVSDYWIDVLTRLAIANTKIIVGRIRSRYTQPGALWTQDGQQILSEGIAERDALREQLQADTQLSYPID